MEPPFTRDPRLHLEPTERIQARITVRDVEKIHSAHEAAKNARLTSGRHGFKLLSWGRRVYLAKIEVKLLRRDRYITFQLAASLRVSLQVPSVPSQARIV